MCSLLIKYSNDSPPPKKNPHCPQLEVSAGASTSWGWAAAALTWMMQAKGIPVGQRKGSGYVKSQAYLVLRLSTSNPIAFRRPHTRNLHKKLAAD